MTISAFTSTPAPPSPTCKKTDKAPATPIDVDSFESAPVMQHDKPTARAFPRPFGVEIEMAGTSMRNVSRVLQKTLQGRAPQGDDVYDALDRRWEVKMDEPYVEVATPILRSDADLEVLQTVVRALEASGARCESGTGVHVHVDAKGFDAPALTYLLALVARHEPYIFSALQVEHERRDVFCRPLPLARVRRAVSAEPQTVDDLAKAFRDNIYTARFVGLNLEPVFMVGGYGTVEFRYFNGSLNAHAIGCYVGYAMALMHHAATAPEAPAPEGAAGLPQLLRTIGLGPYDPVSRLLCTRHEAALEAKVAKTPLLAEAVRYEGYTGDASHLLSMGVTSQAMEKALRAGNEAKALFALAVGLLRYLPHGHTNVAFEALAAVPPGEHAELDRLAKNLLNNPRFISESAAILVQLCRALPPRRAAWARTAERTPLPILTRFAPSWTSPLSHVFARVGLQHTEYQGTHLLATKIKELFKNEGCAAVNARLDAMLATRCLQVRGEFNRGRLLVSLFDLAQEDIAQLAEVTQPLLAPLRQSAPNAYVTLLEAFCEAGSAQWEKYADRLADVLAGRWNKEVLFALDRNALDATELLESDAPITLPPVPVYGLVEA